MRGLLTVLCIRRQRRGCLRCSAAGLTPSECHILKLLWRLVSKILSKPFLYQKALSRACSRHGRSLDMHISQAHRKPKTECEMGREQKHLVLLIIVIISVSVPCLPV